MNPKLSATVAAILWGFTYIVATTMLPRHPMFVAAVRALGAAALLLPLVRCLPPPGWWNRLIVLGTLNAGLFFGLLFVAANRLPGGVAAIFQALGPLAVILISWGVLGTKPTLLKIGSVLIGASGVALVVLAGNTELDLLGVAAAIGSMLAIAVGGVLLNKWGKPQMPLLGFTGWQLLVAGVELLIVALLLGDLPSSISALNAAGFFILASALTAVPFALWFGAIERAGAVVIAPFFLLVPVTAFVLDALIKGFVPTAYQISGAVIVIGGLMLNQWTPKARSHAKSHAKPHAAPHATAHPKPHAKPAHAAHAADRPEQP